MKKLFSLIFGLLVAASLYAGSPPSPMPTPRFVPAYRHGYFYLIPVPQTKTPTTANQALAMGMWNEANTAINIVAVTGGSGTLQPPTTWDQAIQQAWNQANTALTVFCVSGCSGSGSGTVSGQTAGVIPVASSATALTGPSSIADNGTTVSTTEPLTALTLANSQTGQGCFVLGGPTGNFGASVCAPLNNATASFNFNLPDTAGSSGNILTSGGGGTTDMTWDNTTGSGTTVVLATSPNLVTPNIGTPSTAVLTNGTSLPTTGISLNSAGGCAKTSTTDQITAAGAFATTCSITIPATATAIEIFAAGIYTTTSTSSPLLGMSTTIGANTPLPATVNLTIQVSQTNRAWQYRGMISLVSSSTSVGASQLQTNSTTAQQLSSAGTNGTTTIVTGSAQTLSINETATLVAGQTFNLQQLIVMIYQ